MSADTGAGYTAGVDEAGRGPLAGPVVAAAVILDPRQPIAGLADSKLLEPVERCRLADLIRERAVAYAIAAADHAEIDQLNILQATLLAMHRALRALKVAPQHVLVDGNRLPATDGLLGLRSAVAIIKGDVCVPCISAASILAKTSRDALMVQADTLYPEYGFAQHKGYPTRAHLAALDRFGPTPLHRHSFGPVKSRLR